MKNFTYKIIVFVIILFIISTNLVFSPNNILSWDVFGYYLYLPLKFIYNDLGIQNSSLIQNIIEKYQSTSTFYQVMPNSSGGFVMIYTMGLSFFYAPFFFIGHVIALNSNYVADGFSAPYQYSIFIGGIIYSIIGILFLSKVLIKLFDKRIAAIVLILIVVSTNYIIHNCIYGQNAMTHNYLFTAYALILWLTMRWHEVYKIKYLILMGIICGLTILSRPTEFVCLIIPLLWGISNYKTLISKLSLMLKYKNQIIIFSLIILTIGLFQLIYWKIYAGKFIYNSYGGNAGVGLELFHPYLLQVLFSFRKGWLVYTPIMIFAIWGFGFIYKINKSIFFALFLYFIFNLYFVSSWSCWWYAQSYSQRALIPSYPIMAIALGYFIQWLMLQGKIFKSTMFLIIVAFLALNIFQTKQYQAGIIDGSRMTKEYYFRVFGKLSSDENDKKFLLVNRSFNGNQKFVNQSEYKSKVLDFLDFENCTLSDSTPSFSGNCSFMLDSLINYSDGVEAPFFKLTAKDHAWIKITAYVFPTQTVVIEPFSLVVHFNHNEYPYEYKTYDSEKMIIKFNQWNKIEFLYLTPEVRSKNDKIKIYFWNRGKSKVYIDNLKVEVFEKK